MEVIIGTLIITVIICGFIYNRTLPKPKKTAKNAAFKKSVTDDGLLFDPVTGAKITLEQAHSGKWDVPDEETIARNREEISDYSEADRNTYGFVNHVCAIGFKIITLKPKQKNKLTQSGMFSKYIDGTMTRHLYTLKTTLL